MSKLKPINANGDWKGRWSYGSSEWNDVSDDLRKQHNVQIDKGGEFWVCVEDFCEIFEHVSIADTIPNFDEDGFRKADQLSMLLRKYFQISLRSSFRDLLYSHITTPL